MQTCRYTQAQACVHAHCTYTHTGTCMRRRTCAHTDAPLHIHHSTYTLHMQNAHISVHTAGLWHAHAQAVTAGQRVVEEKGRALRRQWDRETGSATHTVKKLQAISPCHVWVRTDLSLYLSHGGRDAHLVSGLETCTFCCICYAAPHRYRYLDVSRRHTEGPPIFFQPLSPALLQRNTNGLPSTTFPAATHIGTIAIRL
jgi:hypothetical protein